MKRLTVFLVLLLTLSVGVLLTSCGCEADKPANQNGQNNQVTDTKPDSGTATPAPNGGSVTDDIIDGGEDIVDGVIEGGKDVIDGVGDALDGDDPVQGGVTYDDMVRNGRVRDGDGFINGR